MKKIIVFIILNGLMYRADAITKMYTSAYGLRAGKFNSGISYKHFFNADNATGIQVDAYITHIADGGYTAKGFYLRQIPFKIPIVQLPLDFIYGFGLHAGYFPIEDRGYYKVKNGDAAYYGENTISVGADITIQIEYQVSRKVAPLTITLDAVPFYEFYHPGPEHVDFGISLRYTFR